MLCYALQLQCAASFLQANKLKIGALLRSCPVSIEVGRYGAQNPDCLLFSKAFVPRARHSSHGQGRSPATQRLGVYFELQLLLPPVSLQWSGGAGACVAMCQFRTY